MFRTVEAVIDEQGVVRLLEPIRLPTIHRALVTILEEPAPLVESALADWDRPEEDAAWAHLQPAPSPPISRSRI